MASIRKKGNQWLAEVRLKNGYRSKLHQSKAEAQRWALETEVELGKRGHILKGKTFGDAMQRYMEEVSPLKKGARWELIRLKALKQESIANRQIADITPDDMQAWIVNRLKSVSNSTVNRELTLLSAVLNVARKRWKWTTAQPMRDIERPKMPQARDRRVSKEEIDRLLVALEYEEGQPAKTIRQKIAVGMLLALETAMRQGELWGMDWKFVNLSGKYVTLPDTKNGTRRNVPLSKRAVELMNMLGPDQAGPVIGCQQASAATIFRRAVELAGIKDLHFHDLRHEAITRLARKLDVLDLARMVGHSDLRSLKTYYNATASEIAERLG